MEIMIGLVILLAFIGLIVFLKHKKPSVYDSPKKKVSDALKPKYPSAVETVKKTAKKTTKRVSKK